VGCGLLWVVDEEMNTKFIEERRKAFWYKTLDRPLPQLTNWQEDDDR
jgi:hypothetical protein